MLYTERMAYIYIVPLENRAKAKGIRSISQFARAAEISRPTATAYWKGEYLTGVNFDALKNICELLDLKPGDIIKIER